MRHQVEWTPEMLGVLEELHARGFSFSQIATALSSRYGVRITRNAVSGCLRRLGRRRQEPSKGILFLDELTYYQD